ncbi:hypothetical protein HZA38_01145 [Candidatus Peregrinibacteria bacterium]|nr:hypothetical protein [Candidatus Peregrinibacteria bacterium]
MIPLLKKINSLLAFFAIWEYPLQKEEIELFLGENVAQEILNQHFVALEGKYYSTISDTELLKKRRAEAEIFSEVIQKKARKFAKILRHFPFLRCVSLCNTGAMGPVSKDSDIDFFLITKKGRIWTARFWSTFFFHIIGLRAKRTDTSGKFCLSFYIDEEFGSFEKLKKPHDIYLPFWIFTLQPFWGKPYFEKFWEENKSWISKEYGIPQPDMKIIHWDENSEKESILQKILEFFQPNFFEQIFRAILLLKSKKFRNPNSPEYAPDMIFENDIQKLHNPDLRNEIQEKWEAHYQNLKSKI